jgi:hypothetical protein
MSLKIRFRFDGRCSVHPRYNPEKDGRPQHQDCPGCDSLWVVYLYTGIARRKAEAGQGMFVVHPEIHADKTESAAVHEEDWTGSAEEQTLPAESGDGSPLT